MIKSSPKKYKTDNSKRIFTSNYSRPVTFQAPPPKICLTFPMQPELKLSHVLANPIIPISTNKTITIFTNKRTIIPPNRLKYLMS
jgi:hypothetical protein